MDLETLYRRTIESWTDRILTVGPEQWGAATPCLEWDVRALVNHVVGEDLWTEPLVRGATIQEVGDRFDGDLLGSDPRETALDTAERASRAVAEALPRSEKVHLSYGDEDLEEYVFQLAADHLIHGWDLAVATDGDAVLDPDSSRPSVPGSRSVRTCIARREPSVRVPQRPTTPSRSCSRPSAATLCGPAAPTDQLSRLRSASRRTSRPAGH